MLTAATFAVIAVDYLYGLAAVPIGILAALSLAGYRELATMLRRIDIRIPLKGGMVFCVAVFVSTYWVARDVERSSGVLLLTLVGAVFVLAGLLRVQQGGAALAGTACGVLGLLYIPLTMGTLVMLRLLPEDQKTGTVLMASVIATVKVGDMTAYFVGTLWGRHKLAPTVSPNKTIEGLAGEVLGGACAAIGLMSFAFGLLSVPLAALLGALISVGGCAGDLVESKIKRICGVTDSGARIPGLGGLLDVLDSVLLGAPAAYLVLSVYARFGLLG